MPASRTQINCPRCRQPIAAQIEQLFDVTSDPGAKQRLLGGISNFAACPHCGFTGAIATPIVYHDSDKELLLTYFPVELKIPINEQEKIIGPLINQVVNKLQVEKRKAYLLQPKSFLTFQSMIENILGADGITPEMIKAQQDRVALIEKLVSVKTDDSRKEIIKQESAMFDAEFFVLFSRFMEATMASGQEDAAKKMEEIQQQLMTETDYGKQITGQVKELEEAVKTLQAAGKELTREKLLEIMISAPNDTRLNALVSMTRPALDYIFFQTLSGLIESKSGDEKKKLEQLREKLLEMTRLIDQRAEKEYQRANDLLSTIIKAEDIRDATIKHLGEISDTFIQILRRTQQEAEKNKDEENKKKLDIILNTLQEAAAPPPEYELLQQFLEAASDKELDKLLKEHGQEITPEFVSFVGSVLAQAETRKVQDDGQDSEEIQALQRLDKVYQSLLKFSMQQKIKQG